MFAHSTRSARESSSYRWHPFISRRSAVQSNIFIILPIIIPVPVPRLASYAIILSQKTTGKNEYHAYILTRALYLSTRMSTKYMTLEDAWNSKIARYAYFACNAVWFYSCCFLKHYFIQFSDMDLGRFCLLPR